MNNKRQKELEAKGYRVTSVSEFLDLTPHEEAVIETRLALSNELKQRRLNAKVSQQRFAKRLKTSQSRVAKMEAGDESVSLDLLITNLFRIGVNRKEIGEILAR